MKEDFVRQIRSPTRLPCLLVCHRKDQFNLSLDPVTARAYHDATLPQELAKVCQAVA